MSNLLNKIPKRYKFSLLLGVIMLFIPSIVMGGYSIDKTSTTNGGGTWGSILRMTASLSGTNITFTVNKISGTFSTASTVYLKVGTFKSYGADRATGSIQAKGSSWYSTHDLSSFSGYPKDFYFRIENSGGNAWVGPITVSQSNSAPSSPVISGSPASADINTTANVSVTIGTDQDGDQVKVQCTATGSNYSTTPYDSGLGSGGRSISVPFFFSSSGNQTIYCTSFDSNGAGSSNVQRNITINQPALTVSNVSASPTPITLNQLTTFTISGSNLISGMGFWIAGCENVTEVSGGNSTSRQFSCTPSYATGQKSGIVKDASGGNVLYNFTVTVNSPLPTVPNAPTATATGQTSISISWSALSDALQYTLWRSTSPTSGYTQIYCAANTSYFDSGPHLSPGTTYYYKLKSGNSSASCTNGTTNWSDYSDYTSVTTTLSTSTIYSINPSSTTNGGGTWGSILNMTASLSGTNVTFTVRKQSGTFKNNSTIYLKVGTFESYGADRARSTIAAGSSLGSNTHNLSSYTGYPKDFYFRVENFEGFAWVGPITVSQINSSPTVSNVGPSSGTYRKDGNITVTWSTSGISSSAGMKVSLKRDSYTGTTEGNDYTVLATTTENDGIQVLPIPTTITAATDWKVWVVDTDRIAQAAPALGTITINSPPPTVSNVSASPASITQGSNLSISWSSTNQHHYSISLYNSDGTSPINTSGFLNPNCSSGNDGCLNKVDPSNATSDSWTIPTNLAAGTYRIKVAVWNSSGQSAGAFSNTFTVNAAPPTVTSISPTTVTLNQLTTFTISGSNLTSEMGFYIADCANPIEVSGGSSTSRQFSCTPSYTTGQKSGVVKNSQGGTELKKFTIMVNESTSGTFYLSFPLKDKTPYTAIINSVFDHSMNKSYCPDNKVIAYTEETGTVKGSKIISFTKDCNEDDINETNDLYGFKKSDGSQFRINDNYAYTDTLYYDGHPGYDYSVPTGTSVLAAADGEVISVDTEGNTNAGKYIKIQHHEGYQTLYLHLSEIFINTTNLKNVTREQLIGKSGNTGSASTGPHLHFEVRKNDIPVDPYGWKGNGSDPYATRATNTDIWTPSSASNNPPIAEAAVSTSPTGPYYGYNNPLTVTQGQPVF